MKKILFISLCLFISSTASSQIFKYNRIDIQFGSNHQFEWADRLEVSNGYNISRRLSTNIYFKTPFNKFQTSIGLGYNYIDFEGSIDNLYTNNLEDYEEFSYLHSGGGLNAKLEGITLPLKVTYDFIENIKLFIEYSYTNYDVILDRYHAGSVSSNTIDQLIASQEIIYFSDSENYSSNLFNFNSNNIKVGITINYKRFNLDFSCVSNLSNNLDKESYHIETYNPIPPKTEINKYNIRPKFGNLGYNISIAVDLFRKVHP